MQTAAKLLHFPLAGVNRARSVRESTQLDEVRDYFAPFAMNVRGTGPFADRRRGGSRPYSLPLKEPSSGGISVVWRDRLFRTEGSVWMASRTGDHNDFDFGGDIGDVTRAVAGNVAFAGRQGEYITAIFPLGDNMVFIATATALWALSGEPSAGSFRLVSPNIGCISQDAWAWDGVRSYVLSANGLYSLSADAAPVRISDMIPQELKVCTTATLSWDAEYNALHVVSDKGSWTYELDARAWWPFDLSSTDSKVAIGPFRTSARDDMDGMLDTLSVTMAEGSSDVSVAVHSGRTPEEALGSAVEQTDAWTCTVKDGFNPVVRPRTRGAWCVIVLSSQGQWAYESITATVKMLGRLRP